MRYAQYDEFGRIACVGSAPEGSDTSNLGRIMLDPPSDIDFNENYIFEGALKSRPLKPSPCHEWDWPTKSWLPNLDAARASKLQQVAAELNKRLYLPCNGFDADRVSRERISCTIARLQRGDGLPAGWMGWRDAANEMRWVTDDAATVLTSLTVLSRAIENREQALLIAAWQHKANIVTLEDIDAILGYDVTKNWPTQHFASHDK